MEKKKSNGKTIILAVAAVVIVLVMALLYLKFKPTTTAGGKQITLEVVHLDKSMNTYKISTDAETVRDALYPKYIDGSEEQFGLWVQTVDGETADASKEEWWGYYVNGEMSMYGVEQQPINDGDIIRFEISVGY